MAIGVCKTIVTWSRFFNYDSTLSHGMHCGCDAKALKDWVDIMLHVYSMADLRLIPWGSWCNCLDAELDRHFPIAPKANGVPVCSALHRLLFKIFIPAWPSILWVLFRIIKEDEQHPGLTFLSMVRGNEQRDLFVWDREDQEVVSSLVHSRMCPLTLEWHHYVSELDSRTWEMIDSLTRVKHRTIIHPNPDSSTLRICTFILMIGKSLNIPPNVAATLDVDITSTYWVQFANIASPAYVKEPQLTILHSIRSTTFWSSVQLKTWLERAAHDRCFDILHASRYTMLERVQLISFILNNHKIFQPLFVFYPATRCTSSRSLEWLTSRSLYTEGSQAVRSFRSDFRELVEILKTEIHLHKHNIVETHTWTTDLSSHALQCLVYLTARLVNSLQTRNDYNTFLKQRGTKAQELLDLIQDLLDLDSFSIIRPMLFKAMWRLSRESNLYPRCFTLTGLHKVGKQLAGGGYGDIWKGLVRGQSVCVKILRIFQHSDITMAVKEFGPEALIWRQLCHPNVLPFFGLYYIEQRLCLISPWMENGHIMEFLKVNSPDLPRRFSMILDVSSGLEYLHKENIIHGDLKGINILVTPSERACIADFGLSTIVDGMTLRLTTSTTANHGGTMRYNAPELFRPGDTGKKTFSSDIYALGCVGYEIMTGQIPFPGFNEAQVMFCVLDDKRPERLPSCIGTPALDSIWELLELCWDREKEKRPSADDITKRLNKAPIGAATTPVGSADWDDQFTARFRRSINMEPLLPSVNQLERTIFGEEIANKCTECFPEKDQVHSNQAAENNLSGIASLKRT
ncbi:kinase domain-containing protein [Favolaschia claudopus]|uniref:Kinase domain-containing protein n=1 Tax=Favolaschia claudopus TaxID=2862362 RepID=A0AAV9Z0M8_9AGAR